MRPRSIERGKQPPSRASAALLNCFNEAAFNRTRKEHYRPAALAVPSTVASMGPRSIERGKVNSAAPFHSAHASASMGPRSIERGKPLRSMDGWNSSVLSMGPRSYRTRKVRCGTGRGDPSRQLQWGRVQSNAERFRSQRPKTLGQRASMGPRSIERGKEQSSTAGTLGRPG